MYMRPSSQAPLLPAGGHDLLARVELDRVHAVGVEVTDHRVLPAREGKPRDGRGDADVDADHPGLGLRPVAADGGPRLGEDRRGVAVARGVDELEGLAEI